MNNQIGGQAPIKGKSEFYKSQTTQDVKRDFEGLSKALNALKESDGVNVLRTKVRDNSSKSTIDLQSKGNESAQEIDQNTQEQTNQVTNNNQSNAAMLDSGDQSLAAVMAALQQEEEFGLSDEQAKDLNEKLDLLLAQAEQLRDVELQDSDHQYELQQMLNNLDKMKQLRERDSSLNRRLEDIEIQLKEQETKSTLNQLPVDETSKKMREQLLHQYEVSSSNDPQELPSKSDSLLDGDNQENALGDT